MLDTKKINLGVLKNELDDDHLLWVNSCEKRKDFVSCEIIDLTSSNWFETLEKKDYDFLLAKPSGNSSRFKQLYDERINLISSYIRIPVYPTPLEIFIYENKRFLYSWLRTQNLPHPKTFCFYNKAEAMKFIGESLFPLVAKSNIGASGSGVKILHDVVQANRYLAKAFSSSGVPRRWGPNLMKGDILKRAFNLLKDKNTLKKKADHYNTVKNDVQSGFVIFQEYVPHEYEWRIVVIGDSYFAHKKLKIGEKASGSLLKQYDNPPLELFDFAMSIMMKYGFYSQAIDIFELSQGNYLINEMQCIFGQSDPYQMLVDGVPGRYKRLNGNWVFEPGNFNANESYDLRIDHILQLIQSNEQL